MTDTDRDSLFSDVCECGHYSRHHNVGKRNGCGHCVCKGFTPENAPDLRDALTDVSARMTAQADQAQAMTDAELGKLLIAGKFTTIETHEAGRRLISRG